MFHDFFQIDHTWLFIGFFAQLLFSMRFLIQWIASERIKKSTIPDLFWYFSLAGGITLFGYAVHRRDPVIMLGQGLGVFIYLRNIYFIHKQKMQAAAKN